MNQSEKFIRNISSYSGATSTVPSNTPAQYQSRQQQYMAGRNADFVANRSYLATDYVLAAVQGTTDNFFSWVNEYIRLSDFKTSTSSFTKRMDDYKQILFSNKAIQYFPIGAKLQTMGNTWICVDPGNMSSPNTSSVIVRCNASYNSYDEYGNIVTEPIYVERYDMLGNNNESPNNLELMDGNFRVICQRNSNTEKLGMNKRIILGRYAYHITGFTDFIQEFTGDFDSTHLLTFTIRIEEPTESDDMDLRIAEGNNVNYSAQISGDNTTAVGYSTQLAAHFLLNGNEITDIPLSWVWSSSNNDVATVDENGVCTGVSSGVAELTATLSQNPQISKKISVEVKENRDLTYVSFVGFVPKFINQYFEETFTAKIVRDGAETEEPVDFSFSGASSDDYNATIYGNSCTIECLSASVTPLLITVTNGEYSETISVELLGY